MAQLLRLPTSIMREAELIHLKNFAEKLTAQDFTYSSNNPIVRWLFWRRLERHTHLLVPGDVVLDFGCGEGAFLPTLSATYTRVIGCDLFLDASRYIVTSLKLPNVQLVSPDELSDLQDASCDIIVAAEVLEHVADLSSVTQTLLQLLKPGGKLQVSLPTETPFYQFGRRLFGFTGLAGHHRGADDAIIILAQTFRVIREELIPINYPPLRGFSFSVLTLMERPIIEH